RVILIWRVVNSSNSRTLQSPSEATRHCGTKKIGNPASFKTRVTRKSSETVPSQRSRTFNCSKVVRRIAVEPPQQKFLAVSAPSAEAIEPFQTDLNREANPPLKGTNQRYPVVAPIFSSCNGATRS